jgi:purine-binding chemotaxis protein CheW
MQENFILFEVSGATYAVRADYVQAVEMVETITRVPNAPDFVVGVAPVRGQVVPVVSIRQRFNLEVVDLTIRSRLIVIRLENRLVAMLVDSAREFLRAQSEQIRPAPESLTGPGLAYLDGVIALPERLALIVHLERLFDAGERDELNFASERN